VHFVQTLIGLMEGFLAAQVDDAAVVEPAVRLPKKFLSEKNAGCTQASEVESGRMVLQAPDYKS
jgi:hypothetical protein